MPTIDHDGRIIDYIDAGDGPPVVLLPPGASPASAWRKVSERLAGDYRTVAVNPSGYGETGPFRGDRPMTVADEAAAAGAVATTLGGPVHLVGHSYGGALALELALSRPDLVATLTLIDAAPYPLLAQAGKDELAAEVEGVNRRYIDMARNGDPAEAFALYLDYYNGESGVWARMPDAARGRLLSLAETVAVALTAAHASRVTLEAVRSIDRPTLVVAGAATDPVHMAIAQILAETIVGARFETVAGAGHMLSLTHPDDVAALIAGFIG